MSLAKTPITLLASQYQNLSNALTPPTNVYVLSSVFNSYSSINSYITSATVLPFYLANVWSELNLGSTMYVSSIISPYATIVGTGNVVGSANTLTVGISNSNFAPNGFVGGRNSLGVAANVFAYGTGTEARGTNAAAFGAGSVASGVNSVAYGISSLTIIGSNQHAHGILSGADGIASHAEGWSTFTYGDFSHTEGIDSQIWGGLASHAEGTDTLISTNVGSALHAEGFSTFVYGGPASHAEGAQTVADIGIAHAEGSQTIALASTAHTEGFRNVVSTFTSLFFSTLIVASNTHVEGACNIGFMPISHVEGLSSVTSGWVSHIEGLANSNATQIAHIEGACNTIQSVDVIGNASSFVRGLSSILTYHSTTKDYHSVATPYNFLSTSYLNHVEGNKNVIAVVPLVAGVNQNGPNLLLHVEGASNSTCGSLIHIEGVSNTYTFYSKKPNIVYNSASHLEGISNMFGINAASFAPASHIEGIRNAIWGGPPHTQSGHLEGFCNRWPGAQEGHAVHFEGSNTGDLAGNVLIRNPHKEGIQCVIRSPAEANNGQFVCGESNIVGGYSACMGQSNDTNVGRSYTIGRYNGNFTNYSVNMGLCNMNCNAESLYVRVNRTILGHYIYSSSNGNFLDYGGVAFFHSTPNSRLIVGSAQSRYLNLMCITSTSRIAYCNLHYINPNNAPNVSRISTIAYYSYFQPFAPLVSYPGSNQITYVNAIDAKLTGYEARRPDASGGLGFYSANFSFAIYRDNLNASNLCIHDMVSRSTLSTNVVSIIPISTTVKPITETNRLQNTPFVNLELYARNLVITAPQNALYGLKINTSSPYPVNWMAELEISQVMRP